jgi:hypothetical protein
MRGRPILAEQADSDDDDDADDDVNTQQAIPQRSRR